MKTTLSTLFLLIGSVACFAQNDQTILVSPDHQVVCFNESIKIKIRPAYVVTLPVASRMVTSVVPGTYTLDNQYILRAANRYSINSLVSVLPGVYSVNGARPSLNGSRPDATAYYIDGIRMLEYEPVFADAGYSTMK